MFRVGRAVVLAAMVGTIATAPDRALAADAEVTPATAAATSAQPFDALPVAGLDFLATQRGGLRAGGLDLAFAANVRTLVNGTLVLESVTNLTSGGTTMQTSLPGAGMDPQTLSFVSGQGGPGSNPLPASLSGLAGQSGVVIEDPTGITTALHSVTREQILGVVLTTASNQQIRQELNVEVTVANFGRFQEATRSALFGGRLLGSLNFTQ